MSLSFSLAEDTRSLLRSAVAQLGADIARASGTDAQLNASYLEVVKQLDLGPEPVLRACPTCGHTNMGPATRCSSCWVKLTPLP
jgi:hypothetical protein